MTTAVTQIKKLLGLKFFDGYLGLIEPISKLVGERDVLRLEREDLETLLSANTEFQGGLFDTVSHVLSERNNALRLKGLVITDMDGNTLDWELSEGVVEIATAPDTTQPQLNEIRYVLHGDIQPCTVLYSDDTTTLLRLDEGDIMCETDTIEWSDSVTYRCQELLKSGGVGRPVDILAQLVRDERILLNDDALESETVRHARHSPTSEQQHDMAKQFVQEIRRASRGMVDVSERPAER